MTQGIQQAKLGEVDQADRDAAEALVTFALEHNVGNEEAVKMKALLAASKVPAAEMARHYAKLVAKTYPVSGRTIIDSRNWGGPLVPIVLITFVALVGALGNDIADRYFADYVVPDEPGLFYQFKCYAWDYLAPFFWAALGSCVYVLKSVYDALAKREFERARFRGWLIRILIGSILGGVIAYLYDPTVVDPANLNLTPNAVSFVGGIFVKVIWGALRKLTARLSDFIGLPQQSTQPQNAQPGPLLAVVETPALPGGENDVDQAQEGADDGGDDEDDEQGGKPPGEPDK